MDIRPVCCILGWLVALLGLLMLAPLTIEIVDRGNDVFAFAASTLLAVVGGASVAVACGGRPSRDLDLRQGFLLTTGGWAVFPAVAGLPLMLGTPGLGFTDAFFEFTSAMTTTGATILVGLDTMPRGALLWRGIVSWAGGVGVVLFAMILLPLLNIGGMQLLRNADFNTLGKIMPRAKAIAISIGVTYLLLTLACTLGYVWTGMNGFDGVVHAMSSIATGGMANYDSSFAGFSAGSQYVCILFMLLGSLSFIRYVQLARGEPGALLRDTQIRLFLTFYLVFCLGLLVVRLVHGDRIDELAVRQILFNMASIISTTGFSTTDYSLWGPGAEVLFFCAMMICGCSGSTSGGPKVFRYQLLFGALNGEMRRLHSPNAVHTQRFQGAAVGNDVLDSVIAFFMLFFLTLGIGAVVFVLLGLDPVSAISAAAACLSNVGPGLGPIIGPVGNYATLSDPVKWVCSFLMLVGRLELMTAFVLFSPTFWRA